MLLWMWDITDFYTCDTCHGLSEHNADGQCVTAHDQITTAKFSTDYSSFILTVSGAAFYKGFVSDYANSALNDVYVCNDELLDQEWDEIINDNVKTRIYATTGLTDLDRAQLDALEIGFSGMDFT